MGASQSGHSRSVNIDNPTPIGVIDVSDEVVQRLKLGLVKNEQAKQSPPQQPASTPTVPSNTPNPYPTLPNQQQHAVLYTEPSITAIEIRRQKELELQQNDLYWRKRLAQSELTLNKTNTIMEKEYSQAINDVRKSFTNAPAIHQLPPCQDIKANLIACYRANPKESLKCSEEVKAFMHCVSENRVKKLDEADAAAKMPAIPTKIDKDSKTVPPKAA